MLTGWLVGVFDSWRASLLFAVAAFSFCVMVREFYSGARARQSLEGGAFFPALGRLVSRNRRRYGGYIVHIGILTLFVGVAASSAFNASSERNLKVGESFTVGGYDVKYVKATSSLSNEYLSFGVVLDVSKDGEHVDNAAPRTQQLPPEFSGARADRALLRGIGNQRGRARRGPLARPLVECLAQHRRPQAFDRGRPEAAPDQDQH